MQPAGRSLSEPAEYDIKAGAAARGSHAPRTNVIRYEVWRGTPSWNTHSLPFSRNLFDWMADLEMFNTERRASDVEGITFAEDLTEIEVEMFPEGDRAAFHTQNDPDDPYQRGNIIERKGRIHVSCEHKDIVHGFHSDSVDSPHTLIVLRFRFDPNGVARRIKEAHITVRFAAMDKQGADPEVVAMEPNGNFYIEPTTQHETSAKSGGLSLGGGAGVEVAGELKAERSIERDTSDATRVRGSVDLAGRNWGAKNSVSWGLWENQSQKTGVVPSLQAGILLKRRDMLRFRSTVKIKVVADTRTSLGSIFSTDPQDDDVWYDPERQPPSTDSLRKYDADNLSAFESDLESVSNITFRTFLQDSERRRPQ